MSDFYKKLIAVQSKLNAPKGQYNSFGKYNYRSCEDIMGAVKPLLADVGLAQFVSDSVEMVGDRYYVKATVTVTDGETTREVCGYAREPLDKKGMDAAQVTGAASSYARKYALNGMYNIDDNKDADTDAYQSKPKNPAGKPEYMTFDQDRPNMIAAKPDMTNEQILAQIKQDYSVSQAVETKILSLGVN